MGVIPPHTGGTGQCVETFGVVITGEQRGDDYLVGKDKKKKKKEGCSRGSTETNQTSTHEDMSSIPGLI